MQREAKSEQAVGGGGGGGGGGKWSVFGIHAAHRRERFVVAGRVMKAVTTVERPGGGRVRDVTWKW